MHQFGSIIGGAQIESGQWLDVHNPYSNDLVGCVAAIDATTAGKILHQTHATTFDLSRHDRAQILNRMADEIEDRSDEIARLITNTKAISLEIAVRSESRRNRGGQIHQRIDMAIKARLTGELRTRLA